MNSRRTLFFSLILLLLASSSCPSLGWPSSNNRSGTASLDGKATAHGVVFFQRDETEMTKSARPVSVKVGDETTKAMGVVTRGCSGRATDAAIRFGGSWRPAEGDEVGKEGCSSALRWLRWFRGRRRVVETSSEVAEDAAEGWRSRMRGRRPSGGSRQSGRSGGAGGRWEAGRGGAGELRRGRGKRRGGRAVRGRGGTPARRGGGELGRARGGGSGQLAAAAGRGGAARGWGGAAGHGGRRERRGGGRAGGGELPEAGLRRGRWRSGRGWRSRRQPSSGLRPGLREQAGPAQEEEAAALERRGRTGEERPAVGCSKGKRRRLGEELGRES